MFSTKKGSTETDECDTDTESTESTGNTVHRETQKMYLLFIQRDGLITNHVK